MMVLGEAFHRWGNWVPETVKSRKKKEHVVWIVHAPF